MALTILSDAVISHLLENLTHDEAEAFAHTLKCALHEYSTGTQSADAGYVHQPQRTSVNSHDTGTTTSFIPSWGAEGHGVKVVTMSSSSPTDPPTKHTGSVTLYDPQGEPVGFLHAQTLTAFRTALASSCLLTKRSSVRTLTVFGSGLQAYWHIRLALMLRGHTIRTIYVINRRFSENAKNILKKFYAIPAEVKAREGWEAAQFSVLTPGYGEYVRLQKEHIRAADVIYCCTPSREELFEANILMSHEGRKKGRLIIAIGGYTPEMRELPKELLQQATKREHKHMHYHKHAVEGGVVVVDTLDGALKEAGEILEAGLSPGQLVELGELAMIHRIAKEEEVSSTDGSSISDSLSHMDLSSAGSAMSTVFGSSSTNTSSDNGTSNSKRSSSQSPSRKNSNSPTHSRKSSFHLPAPFHKRTSSASSVDKAKDKEKHDDHLARWLSAGNVVYKSVGLGLMDLVVGMEIVRLAKEKGVGSFVEGFSS
ncbi:ornithine cyclodeaminase [Xylariaceae sp. FL0016]|nr:ornithine cyclodeaminase [Xylariaceae sp. FL0016]